MKSWILLRLPTLNFVCILELLQQSAVVGCVVLHTQPNSFPDPDKAIVKSETVADKWNKGCAELHCDRRLFVSGQSLMSNLEQ